MSLKPTRQTEQVNTDFITPHTQERGGCLSLAMSSGMWIAQYAVNPSGVVPMGIQLNDIEHMNLTLHPHRTFLGYTTDMPCGTVGIGVQGDFITDWLHLVGPIAPGDPAYLGPSGTFTNSSAFGSRQIGEFRSALSVDPHAVTFRGLGFSRQFIDTATKLPIYENNPAHKQYVATPGFAKIRVIIRKAIQ
jgi:hypothetical protein